MTWLKLDDGFARHRKIAPLSDRAFRLHVTVMLECASQLTDGKMPKNLIDTLPKAPRGRALKSTIIELMESGVWEDCGEEVLVHDYLDFNPSAEEAKQLKDKRAAAGRAGGKQSGSKRQAKSKQVLEQSGSKTEAESNPVPVPVPVPLASEEASTRGVTGVIEDRLFGPDPSQRGKVGRWHGWTSEQVERLRAIGVDPEQHESKFRAHHRGRGTFSESWVDIAEEWVIGDEQRARERQDRRSDVQASIWKD